MMFYRQHSGDSTEFHAKEGRLELGKCIGSSKQRKKNIPADIVKEEPLVMLRTLYTVLLFGGAGRRERSSTRVGVRRALTYNVPHEYY